MSRRTAVVALALIAAALLVSAYRGAAAALLLDGLAAWCG